jgi:outer membrane protein OmpA-like peptidoglycan-associated protein
MQIIDLTSRIARLIRRPGSGPRKTALRLLAMLIAGAGTLSAQPYLGGLADYNVNTHVADFEELPSVPNCCPTFHSGEGRGFTLGLLYAWAINGRWDFTVRGTYTREDGTLKETEQTTVSVNGELTPGSFEHRIETNLSSVGIEPLLGWRPFTGSFGGLLVRGGVRAGFSTRSTFSQREVLVEPTDVGAFDLSGNRIRNEQSGEIPLANAFRASLLGGLSWEILLAPDSSVVLEPEILYSYGLTPIVRTLDWSVNQLRVGAALKFRTESSEEPKPAAQTPLPPRPQPHPVVSSDTPELLGKLDGCDAVEVRPLLPYIFFDMNGSDIPARYLGPRYDPDQIGPGGGEPNANLIDTYHSVLGTLVDRLKANPTKTIQLIGCNSDRGPERGRTTLSMRRARAVRDYLVAQGIDAGRISLSARNLPELYSPPDDPLGIQENRRVEIIADWEIMQPVVVRRKATGALFPSIRFLPGMVPAGQDVRSWRLTATQAGRTVFTQGGDGPTLPGEVRWQPDGSLNRTQPVQYWLDVTDQAGTGAKSPVMQMGVSDDGKPCTVLQSTLIMFDFDRANLSDRDPRILDTFVRPELGDASQVTVTGYTDEIGTPEHNLELSQSRAEAVAQRLGLPSSVARGVGESSWAGPSATPEERFYRRIVVTEVRNAAP